MDPTHESAAGSLCQAKGRDCNGAFEDAVALTDAASSILRTNHRNLKGKSMQKKQRSGRQTGIIPFAAKKTKETDK